MHYEQDYFNYQKNIGAFGGHANLFKFSPYITPTDRVLDYGCGGGYLLANIQCQQKAGVEINPVAREAAASHSLTVYRTVSDVPDDFATVIISNHVLEHVESPVNELRSLLPKLASGGKAVFVVPHQGPHEPYIANDVNQHLYTWNPLTLGNLFRAAGFEIVKVDVIRHQWPPRYAQWYALLGSDLFNVAARTYATLRNNYQIRAVARKSTDA